MRFTKLPVAKPCPDDSPEMVRAISVLGLAQVDVRRTSPYQLKVAGNISFYPEKGTIYRDGARAAYPERGLDALLELLGPTGPAVLEV